jgi:hypothetical protein
VLLFLVFSSANINNHGQHFRFHHSHHHYLHRSVDNSTFRNSTAGGNVDNAWAMVACAQRVLAAANKKRIDNL